MHADHPSTFVLDSLELGLLEPAQAQAARAHADGCAQCATVLSENRAARARFEGQVFARTLPEIERRHARPRWARALILVPSLASLALIAGLVARPQTGGEVTAKGGPIFEVYARRAGRVFAVRNGTALAPGDELRFVVQPAGVRNVLVVSVDAKGTATIYAPFGGPRSAQLASATDRFELPGSVRLDETAGPEAIIAVFSRKPLEAAAVLTELRRKLPGGRDALQQAGRACVTGAVCASVSFEKVVP